MGVTANWFSAGERMKTRSPSVIVIGGGFGGISAARTLQDASFQVFVTTIYQFLYIQLCHRSCF